MAKSKMGKKLGKRSNGGREVLVVGSKVKAYVRGKGAMSSGELIGALSEAVYSMLDRAIERSHGNKRSTVQPRDL